MTHMPFLSVEMRRFVFKTIVFILEVTTSGSSGCGVSDRQEQGNISLCSRVQCATPPLRGAAARRKFPPRQPASAFCTLNEKFSLRIINHSADILVVRGYFLCTYAVISLFAKISDFS